MKRWLNLILKRSLKIEINQVKKGFILQLSSNNKLSEVLSINQKAQARGESHLQTDFHLFLRRLGPSHYKLELKDLKSGAKIFERINSGNHVEVRSLGIELCEVSWYRIM